VPRRREAARRAIVDAAWEVARAEGLAGITLRGVAGRVGMQAPSLYSHFGSKHEIYDAMFGEAWQEFLEVTLALELPSSPRAALRLMARTFVEFAVADVARHQLMNLRTIPGFTPSERSYAPAVRVMAEFVAACERIGLALGQQDVDLYTALLGGLVDAQWANDPGGTRWVRLVDRAVDMYADQLGLPEEQP